MSLGDSPMREESAEQTLPAGQEALPSGARLSDDGLRVGSRLGRYVLLRRLGAGGMGVVYAAFDPMLDRQVAIKLLPLERAKDSPSFQRMLREAKALAQLSHQNVITVFDVGEFRQSLFIAMEYIAGKTLGDHVDALREEERNAWREIVRCYREAGRGLEAAHAAGIVHRDFKPANVMVAEDGRVLVLDFGLAAGNPSRASEDVDGDPEAARSSASASLDHRITETGALMGTPAYMAPEQLGESRADERADQFSFCVSLYEGLYGQRPFAADSLETLTSALLSSEPLEPPPTAAAPGWLWPILRRGLSKSPDDRFASMSELLVALGRDPARRRRAMLLGVGGFGLVFGAGALGALAGGAEELCVDADEAVHDVWTPERADEIRAAFVALDRPYAKESVERVVSKLDAYANAWSAQRRESCDATRVRGEQPDGVFTQRTACLDRSLNQMEFLLDELAEPDRILAAKSVALVEGLPRLDRCADTEALLADVPPPADLGEREKVAQLRKELDAVVVAFKAGRAPGQEAVVDALVEKARNSGYEPAVAEAQFLAAQYYLNLRKADRAKQSGWAAILAAEATGHVNVLVKAQLRMAFIEAVLLNDFEAAGGHLERAEATMRRWKAPPEHVFLLHRTRAQVDSANQDLELTKHWEALWAARVEAGLDREPSAVSDLALMLNGHRREGNLDRAGELAEVALERARELLGPADPDRAIVYVAVAHVRREQGDHKDALANYRRAEGLFKLAIGDDYPDLVAVYNGMGLSLRKLGRWEEALGVYQSALRLAEASFGPRHLNAAALRRNLGLVYTLLERREDAIREHETELEIRRERLPAVSVEIGFALYMVGWAYLDDGRLDDAERSFGQGQELFEKLGGPDDLRVIEALNGRGRVAHLRGHTATAIQLLERALELAAAKEARQVDEEIARLNLAEVLADRGDTERALSLATAAEAYFADGGPTQAANLARVRAFLERYRP